MGHGPSPGTVIGPLAYLVPLPDSILQNEFWNLSHGLTSEEVLREEYLAPLWKQGLIAEVSGGYVVGPQWELVRPYQKVLEEAREAGRSIEQLANQESWIEQEELPLRR